MARTWLSIRLDLVEGHGERLWPRPGRIFAAARSHTSGDLGAAIDDAFARWDRSPLADLVEQYAKAGGRLLVCPICMQTRNVDPSRLMVNAEVGGTVPLWEWIGDDQVVTFSY